MLSAKNNRPGWIARCLRTVLPGAAPVCALIVCVLITGGLPRPAFSESIGQQKPGTTGTALDQIPAKKLFGHVKSPARMRANPYGFYTKGCLAGGVHLPDNGSAWQSMRLKRNRQWGHPVLVELIKKLAIEARALDGWPGLLVGDMSQPRGGPMLTGHRSHQIGLDADIWLTPMPDRTLTGKERQTISAISMVRDRKRINRKVWTTAHARLIRRAASYPEVARIFVHPPIKRALCDWAPKGQDRSWLKKVRAYYGHNYHFHIRLNCPPGAIGCRNQAAPNPADGDGCGRELAYWYSDAPWKPKKPRKKKKKKKRKKRKPLTLAGLPNACRSVITAK